jgi:tRNA pseudouridine55 synthase
LYEYARAGIEVEREAREITIHELEVTLAQEDSASPAINMTVTCSKGTYIRTLGEDIGEALGCGAHLSALRRVGTGGFDVSQCVTLAALEAMTDEERIACLMPVESLLVDHTVVMLAGDDAGRFSSGMRRRGDWPDAGAVAVFGPRVGQAVETDKALLGTAQIKAGELIPGRLLSPAEIFESHAQQVKI